jgi:diguanylate cyclase
VQTLRGRIETIRQEALTDQLTGLANRKCFDDKLTEAVREAASGAGELCLLFGDIDFFKTFNDTWGHQTGDQVLRLVSMCMSENLKGRDTAARYGGEEFTIILPQTSLINARTVADAIRVAVQAKKIVKRSTGETLGSITMSIGVASYHRGETADSLVQRADACLYAAKRSGRNRVTTQDEVDIEMVLDDVAEARARKAQAA